MPIVDIAIVVRAGEVVQKDAAHALANFIAGPLNASPGKVWVRLQLLPEELYAENGEEGENPSPVFVNVLHADLKPQDQLEREASALAQAIGTCLARSADHVHIEYAPAGRGRIAFGGRLLR